MEDTFTHYDLVLRPKFHSCKWKGHKVRLTRAQYALLLALIQLPGAVLSREQLLDHMSRSAGVYDRSIDGHIRNLRQRMRVIDPQFDLLETVHGVRYCLREYP